MNVDTMNYTLIVSDREEDFNYMESTCYLTKLQQKGSSGKLGLIKALYLKSQNCFYIEGLDPGIAYYMNILARNEKTGEVITYKPIMLVFSAASSGKLKVIVYIFLILGILGFLYGIFTLYRKYRIQKMQLSFVEEKNTENSVEKKAGSLSSINIDFVKKNDNNIN